MDYLSQLKDALIRAEAKEKRLVGQLDVARREREEIQTAVRVIERMSASPTVALVSGSQSDNGQMIYGYVGVGHENGRLPKEIIESLKASGHDLGDDLVRTQLWRMAKRKELEKHDGRYFRPVTSLLAYAEDDGFDGLLNEKAPNAEAEGAFGEFGRVAELEGPEKTEQRPFRTGENVGSSPTPPASPYRPWDTSDDLDDDIPF